MTGTGAPDPSAPESPTRDQVQAALAALRDQVRACTGGVVSSIQTKIEFRGRTGRPARITVTTDRDVDVAACVGQVLLNATVPPFTQEPLTVDYPWNF